MSAPDTTAPVAPSTRSSRLKAARAALILVPIFFVAVMAVALAGLGRTAEVAESKRPPAAEATLDPAVEASLRASLPDDATDEQKDAIVEAAAKSLAKKDGPPQGARNRGGEEGGGALGGLMGLFFLVSIIVFVTGIWRLLADRAPGFVRVAGTIALPLMVLTGLATTGLGIVALAEQPEEKKRPFNTLAVMADRARVDDVQLMVKTQGETQPRVEIDLVPEVGGKIVYVSPNFITGGIFRRGETLVRIDPSDYEVAVVSAEANLANARQSLAREIAEGEIARADIADLGITNPSALALRDPQRQQAEAAVKAAESELERARIQLGRTSVRAPFDGRVREKSSDVGQFVSPGARLGRIFSTDAIEVRLPLTDADLAKLDLPIAFVADNRATAPRVTLSAEIAGERRRWEARIVRTDATYDRQTRALFAIAEVADPYGEGLAGETGTDSVSVPLAPGLFVDAEIEGRRLEDVVVLPRDGLRPRDEVYVVDDKGKAEIRTASVIDTDATRAVLRPGTVNAGEIVIVSPMERSRIETPLQVLDVNDPATVLVEPERPAWMGGGDENSRNREGTREAGSGNNDNSGGEASRSDNASGETASDGG